VSHWRQTVHLSSYSLENGLLEHVTVSIFVSALRNCLKSFWTTRPRCLILLWS